MLEAALALISVFATLSAVGVALIFARMQAKLLDHIRDCTQIGGTPLGLASKQTDFELARIQQEQQKHQQLVEELRTMKEELANPRGPLS